MARQRSDLDNNILSSLGEAVVTETDKILENPSMIDLFPIQRRALSSIRDFLGQDSKQSPVGSLNPEDEVVVTPEGIGPLMYGRSKLGDIGDRLSSGIGSLKNIFQYYFGDPTVNVELLDYIDSMRNYTNNLEEATEALYPIFQEMNPSISYAKLREILMQRGFVPSRQTEEDLLPETIIRPQPDIMDLEDFGKDLPPKGGVPPVPLPGIRPTPPRGLLPTPAPTKLQPSEDIDNLLYGKMGK